MTKLQALIAKNQSRKELIEAFIGTIALTLVMGMVIFAMIAFQ